MGHGEGGNPYPSHMTGERFYKHRPTLEKPSHARGVRVMVIYHYHLIPMQPSC